MTVRAVAAATRAAMLGFLRDPGSLVTAFLLPPVIFLVFAAIFSNLSGGSMRVRVALVDEARADSTTRLAAALREQPTFRVPAGLDGASAAVARAAVRSGEADAAIVLKDDLKTEGPYPRPPILVLALPERSAAAAIAAGGIQRALFERLPDIAMARVFAGLEDAGRITTEQREFLEDEAAKGSAGSSGKAGLSLQGLIATDTGHDGETPLSAVAVSTGALTVLFLMIAAAQGAFPLLDERERGLHERVAMAAPRALDALVVGRFLLIGTVGIVQAALVALAARIVHGVNAWPAPVSWFSVTAFTAFASAGLALAVVSASRTLAQAHTFTTFGILLCGAVGGSMVPTYLMPAWLRDLGHLTPNAWAIDAYSAALRGHPAPGALVLLAALSAAGLLAAILSSRRAMRRY